MNMGINLTGWKNAGINWCIANELVLSHVACCCVDVGEVGRLFR